MKKISLKEIAFPLDVEVIKKILQRNGIVKVAELPNTDGFYLLDENGFLIPSRKILEIVWERYLSKKIADYIKASKANGFHINIKKQTLTLYYLPEDLKQIEVLRETKKLQKTAFAKADYIS